MRLAACFLLLLLTACAVTPSDPYTAQAWAAGAIDATQQAVIDRAQVATLEADRIRSDLAAQQTRDSMSATQAQRSQEAAGTQIAAQHTAVMQAIQATNDWHIIGLQREARVYEEYTRQTQNAMQSTATQGAIHNAARLDAAKTNGIIYIFGTLSCLSTLALLALIGVIWARQMQKARVLDLGRALIVTPWMDEPYLLSPYHPAPEVMRGEVVSPVVSQERKQDELIHEVGRLLLGSARVNGWESNQIAGHRDLEIGGGKWHRIIDAIRGYVNTDRTGTTLIDGTLRDFYLELRSGAIELTHPAE